MKSLLFSNTEYIGRTVIIYNGRNKKYFEKSVFLTVKLFFYSMLELSLGILRATNSITEISITKYHLKNIIF